MPSSAPHDYLYKDLELPDTDHPDSCIRLAAVVHRFRLPRSTKEVSFSNAFRTVGQSTTATRTLLRQADEYRQQWEESCQGSNISAQRVLADAARYRPCIHTLLLSCQVQPENARLDEKLVFSFISGLEKDGPAHASEALMYDLVMVTVSQGLGHAAAATEHSVAGDFAAAAREYAAAAGVFDYLATDQLPKWVSKGAAVDTESLPAECSAPCCAALNILFQAHGQQMAIGTLLIKATKGTKPNYSLLAKLSLGVQEQLETFTSTLRREAFAVMGRFDKDFLTLIAVQIALQNALALYFQARHWWDDKYGLAIALLSEATVALGQRKNDASPGMPDLSRTPALAPLVADLQDLRAHMKVLLNEWEKDNNQVYFEAVPPKVLASDKIREGLVMGKVTEYTVKDNIEPVALQVPDGSIQRSDSDLARELQRKLNAS